MTLPDLPNFAGLPNLLNPAAAWWLLLVPLLVILYMLRPHSRRLPISSLRLWKELPQVERPTPRLRRPPLSWLLLLQALLLGVGAFALMQPAFSSPAAHRVLVMLDTSGSMQMRDGATNRFEEARTEAAKLASGLGSNDLITLLNVGPNVATACQACKQADYERALHDLQPGAGHADWSAAVALAGGLAGQTGGSDLTTYAISDGAFSAVTSASVPAGTHFIQVGTPADNLAITVLSARRPPNGTPGYSAYARVENASSSPSALDVTALADTVPLPARSLRIPAGGHADVTWQVPDGTVKLTVNLGSADALAADNSAVLFLPAEGQNKVAVKSEHADLYMRALSGYHGLQPVTDTVKSGSDTAFTVWDGELPAALPPSGLLLVNPSGGLLPTTGSIENVSATDVEQSHPLMADLDLRALLVEKARKFVVPDWLEPVVQSPGGPLVLAGERDGRRIAVLTFDPADSNLPKLAAFPLLMANLADWLYPQAGVGALHPSDAALVPPGSTVTTPAGSKLLAGDVGVFAETGEVGIYSVAGGKAGDAPRLFSVNMADEQESTLAPKGHPELERAALPGLEKVTIQDFWWPVSLLALVLASGEWLLYCLKRGRI